MPVIKLLNEMDARKCQFFRSVSQIPGWCGFDEIVLLRSLVLKHARKYPVLEIGSFHGKSTVVLAQALVDFGRDLKVFSVDPHLGQLSHQQKVSPSYEAFLTNLKTFGLKPKVVLIQKKSEDAVKDWYRKLSLIHIDGLHDFISVKNDLLNWYPFLAPGGVITCHDAFGPAHPDVTRAVLTLLTSTPVKKAGIVGSEVYICKGRPNFWQKAAVLKIILFLSLSLFIWENKVLPFIVKIILLNFILKPFYLERLSFITFLSRYFKLPILWLAAR